MALTNPNSLYSEGNVSLDSSPYTRIVLQQRAKKQALEEAANQYFAKLPERLNTAGVRQQDLEDPEGNGGILKDIETLRENWYRNKDSIRKGGAAQQQHMAAFDRVRQKIEQSKNRAKTELTIGKAALQPNGWKPRDSDHPVIEALGASIYNPKSKKEDGVSEYGLGDLSVATTPYSAQKQQQYDKAVLNGISTKRDMSATPVLDALGEKVLNTHKYDQKDIYNAAQRAAQIVDSDRTMYYRYEDLLDNPDDVKIASEALSKLAGTPVVAQTPQQMAAGLKAYELSNFSEQKEEKDVAAANAFKKKMQDERLAAQLRNLKLKEAGKNARLKQMQNYNIEDVHGKVEAAPSVTLKGLEGYTENFKDITDLTDAEREDFLGKASGDQAKFGKKYKNEPIKFGDKIYVKVNEDGSFSGKDGVKIDADQVLVNTFSRTGKLKKPLGKGELKIKEVVGNGKEKTEMTLAERMKAAKKQK